MGQALAWLIPIVIIVLVIWTTSRENERRRGRSTQEFERDVAEAQSSKFRAGALELDKFVGDISGKRAAVHYLKDEEQGQTKSGGKDDDKDRTEVEEQQ